MLSFVAVLRIFQQLNPPPPDRASLEANTSQSTHCYLVILPSLFTFPPNFLFLLQTMQYWGLPQTASSRITFALEWNNAFCNNLSFNLRIWNCFADWEFDLGRNDFFIPVRTPKSHLFELFRSVPSSNPDALNAFIIFAGFLLMIFLSFSRRLRKLDLKTSEYDNGFTERLQHLW